MITDVLTARRLLDPEPSPMQQSPISTEPGSLDQRFLRYARTVDAAILDALICEVIDSCFRQARRITGDNDVAEDAVQEAFLKLVRTAGKYDGSIGFSAWLGRLVCSAAIDQHRRARRHGSLKDESNVAETGKEIPDQDDGEIELIRRALNELPDRYRLPLMLHYLSGLSQAETAASMGVSLGTLTVRLTRAREKLREKLLRSGSQITTAGVLTLLAGLPSGGAASESLRQTVLASCADKSLFAAKAVIGFKSIASICAGATVILGLSVVVAQLRPQPDNAIESAASANTFPSGLVGHWRLDEGAGPTTADSSGNGNDGTLCNGPVWSTGVIGNALAFDGRTSYVEVPYSASIAPQQLTVAAWFKVSSFDRSVWKAALVNQGEFEFIDGFYGLGVHRDGRTVAQLNIDDGSKNCYDLFSSSAVSAGEWHHVAMTYDNVTFKFYTDGAKSGSKAINKARTASAESLTMGVRGDGGYHFNGTLDDVRIYNRALSPEEIAALFALSDTNGFTP